MDRHLQLLVRPTPGDARGLVTCSHDDPEAGSDREMKQKDIEKEGGRDVF